MGRNGKEVKRMSIVSPETVVISRNDCNVITIVVTTDSEAFAEKLYSSEKDITLKDIEDEYEDYDVITVICETPLEGVIYQYGNYNDGKWHTHGKTVGYA